jgi:hypothetical protein
MKKASSVLSFDQYLNEGEIVHGKIVYGREAIKDLMDKLDDKTSEILMNPVGSDENIVNSKGEKVDSPSAMVVSKAEYIFRRLKEAERLKKWAEVDNVISYIEKQMRDKKM